MYRREPLSLRSEPPSRPVARDLPGDHTTDPVHTYLHHRSPSASHLYLCMLHLLSFIFFSLRTKDCMPLLRSREGRRNLKEAGRFKTALFPKAVSSKDLNNIVFSSSSFISTCFLVFFAFVFNQLLASSSLAFDIVAKLPFRPCHYHRSLA